MNGNQFDLKIILKFSHENYIHVSFDSLDYIDGIGSKAVWSIYMRVAHYLEWIESSKRLIQIKTTH